MLVFLYMLGCTFCFAAMTAVVKYLHDFPTSQVVFFRCFIALLLPLIYLVWRRDFSVLRTSRPFLHLLRATLGLTAMYFFFVAFQHVGLVEVQAIGKAKAIFIAFFAMLFLREKLTPMRIGAVLIGFVAVVVILNPTVPKTDLYLYSALCGALFAALAMICVRTLGRTEDPLAIVIYFMTFGSVVSLCFALPVWQEISLSQFFIFSATGVLGVGGQLCMVHAYKIAQASVVAPFDYLELVWATLMGFVFWSEIPTFAAIIGSVIILFSQLILTRSESVQARKGT